MKKPEKKNIKKTPLPSKEQILAFIRESATQVGKREIARAFNIRGEDKIGLKALLRELSVEGAVEKGAKRQLGRKGALPPIEAIEITHTDKEGELFAKPVNWDSSEPPPKIIVIQPRFKAGFKGRFQPLTVGVGDRVLAKITSSGDNTYEARAVKKLAAAPSRLLGVYKVDETGWRLLPVDKKYRFEVVIAREDAGSAMPGELVAVEIFHQPHHGPQRARVTERLGDINASNNLSLIAIHQQGIPHAFNPEAVAQAQAKAAPLGDRVDLRNIPLVTIDGEDARDFDDAVFAEPDTDPANPGGWHLLVAIADVAWYVRPGDALDKDAYARGNSVYFPDRVVPMLPEELSNGWCSLKPHEDRSVLAAHMWISAKGKLLRHKIIRGMMHSAARLTYNQVQAARDGNPDEITAPLMEDVIAPLYGAYAALEEARATRGTLELNITERKIIVDRETNNIVGVEPRARYDSHKLIEEFMIAANVAAAETLAASAYPAVYRIHDRPDPERIIGLQEALQTLDLKFPDAGATRPAEFNRLLAQVRGGPNENMVNTLVLRTQAQAVYSPENIGHFGLGLRKYVHFTSPIRRYSDLLVHRALIAAHKLGEGGWNPKQDPDLVAVCEYISMTERRAALAERQTVDRFTAAFLADRVGVVFRGRISGVTRFGLFVNLDETGADGILPMRNLPQDFYDLDERGHRVIGRRSGMQLRVGDIVDVRLKETDKVSGGIVFEYAGQTKAGVREHKNSGREAPRKQVRRTPKKAKRRR